VIQLSERQERILKMVIEMYVSTAHPIGSAALVSNAALGISSATVRHEMAILEELGFIHHLHTSGGRVPTKAGYRYYVERLMEPVRLPNADARTIRHQFHQVHTEMGEWLKLAATVMAYRMHNVGLITAPKATEGRLRHLEVISTQHAMALLIVVLQNGSVLQEMITLTEPQSQETLSALADRLSQALRGLTSAQIEGKITAFPPLDLSVATIVVRLLKRGEDQHAQLFHAGLAELIRQPEFLEARPGEPATVVHERLHQMVEFLHQGFALQRLLAGLPAAADVQVVIGSETAVEGLHDYSFVLARYGDEEDSSGYLGIVGPTRMEYPRAVALVRYMTDLMSDLMSSY